MYMFKYLAVRDTALVHALTLVVGVALAVATVVAVSTLVIPSLWRLASTLTHSAQVRGATAPAVNVNRVHRLPLFSQAHRPSMGRRSAPRLCVAALLAVSVLFAVRGVDAASTSASASTSATAAAVGGVTWLLADPAVLGAGQAFFQVRARRAGRRDVSQRGIGVCGTVAGARCSCGERRCEGGGLVRPACVCASLCLHPLRLCRNTTSSRARE
jgi:hypothetical protein